MTCLSSPEDNYPTFDNGFPAISSAFISDETSRQLQQAHRRDFLKTGTRPAVGQRVELICEVSTTSLPLLQFRMSGQVTSIIRPVQDNLPRPQKSSHEDGKPGTSWWLSHQVLPHPDIVKEFLKYSEEGKGQYYRCGCGKSECAGMFFMERSVWETEVDPRLKQRCWDKMKSDLGAMPGTEVKVEARLNFFDDSRRAHLEGPWKDKIDVDGRDVWEFVLEMDDSRFNVWSVKDFSTIQNLGQKRQPRFFPWSNNSELSYGFEMSVLEMMGPETLKNELLSSSRRKSRRRWLFTGLS